MEKLQQDNALKGEEILGIREDFLEEVKANKLKLCSKQQNTV